MDNEPPACMYFEVNEMGNKDFLGVSLCWHSTPAYYAFYYAGIFDVGIVGGLTEHI